MEEPENKNKEPSKPDMSTVKALNREDFMKRWFAIALSVGFATALSRMDWIVDQRILMPSLPVDWHQVNQGLRLLAAGTATLLSWEGYLISIGTKPLIDGKRFYVDVFLVTLYLVLLLTSSSQQLWIAIHLLTFAIYVVWDFLSIQVHLQTYVLHNFERYTTRSEIYRGVFQGSRDIRHGPIVTLLWPIYLGVIAATYYGLFDPDQRALPAVTALYFAFIIFGLFGYRSEKNDEKSSRNQRVRRIFIYSTIALALSFLFAYIVHFETIFGFA